MPEPLPVPTAVFESHSGWTSEIAYSEYWSASTWRLRSRDGEIRFCKVAPAGRYPDLAGERDRMDWLAGKLPVPRVLSYGTDGDVEWLLTAGLPGRDATDEHVKADPRIVVPILGSGLRSFHEIDTDHCPFDFRLDAAIAHVRGRIEAGSIDRSHLHPEHAHLTAVEGLAILERDRPAHEDVVVCHGDYCFPNVLIDDGHATGYVDLGEAGLADRWWDLAVATWSCTWNVGPGWEDLFCDSYGIEPDAERIAYYRLLYDLSS